MLSLKHHFSHALVILLLAVCTRSVRAQNFGEMIRSSDPLTAEEELNTFTVPEGFKVQLFASEPEIQKPMNMAFDSQGRLWVSGSNDYPFPNFTESATDSIRILEDTDNDGRADKFTTFVEGITIPMGLYPYQDGVIAFTIPNIVFYRDTDGDGKSDTSEVLYGPFDYSRDTHGLNNAFRRGLDGWIYACHGFNNNSKVAGTDGHVVSMQSGNTYRFKIDGSRIEHYTHGQVNPFGMTFDPWGDLYSSDCHTVPVSLIMKDGYFPSFGKPHDGLGFIPAVMSHLHGSTAIAGVSQYTGTQFPPEYQRSLFVGNVMTSRVHRDIIQYTGSSVKVVEQPDFLTSSDSWFRPVDIQCGPDQAFYIADFYNRIIGHYEIPLDHPDRDRNRGRIWRVTYDGAEKSKPANSNNDITQLKVPELINSLADSNLPKSYRIVDELIQRSDEDDLVTLEKALANPQSPAQHAYLLWVLHRLGKLSPDDLRKAFGQNEPLVQVHVQRILADQKSWSAANHQLVVDGLAATPIVARSAAMAMANQPDSENIAPILKKLKSVPATDLHLRHALKIALRNSLQVEKAYDDIAEQNWSATNESDLVAASLAVKSEDSAKYLLSKIRTQKFNQAQLKEIVTLAARHLQSSDVPQLVKIVREQFSDEIDLQTEVLLSVIEGVQQKGAEPTEEIIQWGNDLASIVFEAEESGLEDWQPLKLDAGTPLKWDLETRSTADGKENIQFLSSLPAGETATGVLRSKSFVLPETLSFYLCGHLGFPKDEPLPKNFVSLHLANDGKPVKVALVPRNDTAQKITWDLSEFSGEKGFLQVNDGIDLTAYAWIAIHGIEPPVVSLPTLSPKLVEQRLRAAVTLVDQLQLSNYQPECTVIALNAGYPNELRFEALRFLARHHPEPINIGLLNLYREESPTQNQREQIAGLILDADQNATLSLLKTLPLNDQTTFARALTNFEPGAKLLIEYLGSGVVSPLVLQSPVVMAQIENLNDEALKNLFLAISHSLPDANLELNKLIEDRIQTFQSGNFDHAQGKVIFQRNCSACHSIEGIGKKIGPQLDGIGNRGLNRLLEDILAPNRNIDLAFRSHTYLLEDGKVQSGLFRRKEGELTIIANQKGEEISFSTNQIEAEKVSAISIMPENWKETIPQSDFNHLVAYLLAQRQKIPAIKETVNQSSPE
ncbi:c-type cytochrome [Planctomicrobium sp.]|jgi:putative heme-binding domain-containing protein|nr:PVC-type heme-binding CxxCH protein [Planctomicrobium sp.]MBT5019185.1 c-type cytochrome [Planctomicrobium sp.]MDB4439407.1 c-type cytochrome [Planctomicrobium sp.]